MTELLNRMIADMVSVGTLGPGRSPDLLRGGVCQESARELWRNTL